jgi:hypothetical protein
MWLSFENLVTSWTEIKRYSTISWAFSVDHIFNKKVHHRYTYGVQIGWRVVQGLEEENGGMRRGRDKTLPLLYGTSFDKRARQICWYQEDTPFSAMADRFELRGFDGRKGIIISLIPFSVSRHILFPLSSSSTIQSNTRSP